MNRALKTTIKSMGLLIGLSVLACGLSSCGMLNQQAAQSDVHVILNDGQVIVGELTTPIFTLKTELGTLKFDTDEAGELGPLEGNDMKQSDKLVRLWLKNGSEFVGSWQKASVEMSLRIGDKDISIDVPIDKLKRLRFKGDPVWSDKPLYRVVTRSGDDFFVEADSSQIHFTSELGSFSPYLAEISSLVQLDGEENKWQVQLKNGSRLNAEIRDSGLELKPAQGPEQVSLSWALVARLEPAVMNVPTSLAASESSQVPPSPGYYSNESQKAVKAEAARSWKH